MIITLPVKEWLPCKRELWQASQFSLCSKSHALASLMNVFIMVSSLCVPPPLPRPVKNHLGFKLGTLASFLLYFILSSLFGSFVGLAYQGKDLVFRFIIEYSSLMDFGPYPIHLFLCEDF
jgi:hypothetical protein